MSFFTGNPGAEIVSAGMKRVLKLVEMPLTDVNLTPADENMAPAGAVYGTAVLA
jgi:hypothetical protein